MPITLEKAKKYEYAIEKFLRAVEYQKKVLQVNTKLIEAAYRYFLPFVDAYMKYTNGEINKAFSKKYIKKFDGFRKDRAVDITTNLLDWGKLDNTGVTMLKPATLEVMARSGDVANKIAGIEGAFDIVNPEVVTAVNKIALNAVVEVGKETKLAINEIIRQGLIDGKSMGKIAKELRPLVGLTSRQAIAVEKYRKWLDLKRPELTALKRQKWVERYRNKLHKYRTNLIARTESSRAVSEGQRISYRDAGYTILRWEANVDACSDCDVRSGHTYTVEEAEGLIPLHPACYNNETEVYSNDGWKLFKDLKGEELILSLNPKTFDLEWLPYVKKIEYHYKGEMIHLKSKQIDLLATPNHSQLYNKDSEWEIEELQEVIKYPKFKIPRTVNWKSKDLKIEEELFDISKKNNSIKKIDYDGMVYDVELPRNHVLWVKRNGKTCWSGNCRCTWIPESRARKVPKEPIFIPAKTIGEAEKFATNLTNQTFIDARGNVVGAQYGKVSLDNANMINEKLYNLIKEYRIKPDFIGSSQGYNKAMKELYPHYRIKPISGKVFAQTEYTPIVKRYSITFNEKYFKKGAEPLLKESLELCYNTGFHQLKNISHIVDHEYAHVLDGIKKISLKNNFVEEYQFSRDRGLIKTMISGYADADGLAESWAEIFAMYRADKLPPLRMKLVEELLK